MNNSGLELNFSFPATLIKEFEKESSEYIKVVDSEVVISEKIISGVNCNIIKHKDAHPKRKLIYIHGGAFMFGNIKDYHYMCGFLSKFSQCEIVFINYRLAPQYPFPAALDDCLKIYKEVVNTSNDSKVYLCGDSAGATLCLGVTFLLMEEQRKLPNAIVSICVSADEERRGKSWIDNKNSDFVLGIFADMLVKDRGRSSAYLRGHPVTDKLVSPRYGNFEGFPPVLLQTSNVECLRDDSILLYLKMCNNNVDVILDVHNMVPHVWHLYGPLLEESMVSLQRIGEFLLER